MLITLLILIFIRPFISSPAYPYANSVYSIFLLGFLALWMVIRRVNLKEITPIILPLILFILALFISLIFSQDKIISIKEIYKYLTGILLLLASASLTHKEGEKIVFCIISSGLLISFLAFYQYLFGFQRLLEYITKQGISDPFILDYINRKRVFFPFVTPNVLGGYLAMLIPLALTYKNRIWLIIPLSLALLLTRSVGALLSLFFGLAIYFYLQGNLKKGKVLFLFGFFIIIVFVLIARSVDSKQHTQPIFSTVMRFNYWLDTLKIIKAHIFTGVGIGNLNLRYSSFSHNSYLQLWAEMGCLGIISFLWLIIAGFKSCLKNLNNILNRNQLICLLSASSVFLIHNLTDFTFFLPELAMFWWVILGLKFLSSL